MGFIIPHERGLLRENQLGNVSFKKQNEGYTTSAQANQGAVIEFIPMHFKNTPVISFIAFLDDIKDNVKQTFTPQQPFGRMDPIQTFKRTGRKISFGWDVIAGSLDEAHENQQRVSLLLQMLYVH